MANLVYKNFPKNQLESEFDYPRLITSRLSPADQILFLLEQEVLYAQNLFGYGNFVNPHAVLGQLPFTRGDVYTSIDYQLKDTTIIPTALKKIIEVGQIGTAPYIDENRNKTIEEVNKGGRLISLTDTGKELLKNTIKNVTKNLLIEQLA